MDEGALRKRLTSAELVLGPVAETIPEWSNSEHPPVGFIAFDLDYYSSTVEAFQLLDNAAGILYGLTYLVLFALPLLAGRSAGAIPRGSRALKIAAAAGLLTTVLYVALSIFPIIDVPSWRNFAAKISSVVIGLNVLGFLVYSMGGRRRDRSRRVEVDLAR